MKSKRAYVMLSNTAFPVSEEESNDEYIDTYDVVTFNNAQTAVELAEEDMAEKAINAYIQCCEWREGEDSCVAGYKCDKCPSMDNFKQKLME